MTEDQKKEALKEDGKYVYCIIHNTGKEERFGNLGIENYGEVYTITYKDIAAVVSDSPLKDYQAAEENVKTHNEVINLVMKNHSVIPMAFGMVFNDKNVLLSVLEKSYNTIKKSLALLDNKAELGVKVILSKELMALFDEERRRNLSSYIFELLKEKAVDATNGNLFSERLLVNASFLVEKNKIEEFSKEVEKVEEILKPRVQYSGPWPPYNFVKINIGKGD